LKKQDLLQFTPNGLYCPQADVYIDPMKKVKKAIITHAHSDHARAGHNHYAATPLTGLIMKHRIGPGISVEEFDYHNKWKINDVLFSFHPAGHIPGSAQLRVEYKGEVWVVSGDYKTHHDGISTPFEPVSCHTFITESTFGLPVFRWENQDVVLQQIIEWWSENQQKGKQSVLIAYSLGKAQRLIHMLKDNPAGKVWVHGAVHSINELFETAGLKFGNALVWNKESQKTNWQGDLIIAPPSVIGSRWIKRFQPYSLGIASGWMAMRGTRRRRAADRGFVLSDHADWNELHQAIQSSNAERVITTHGYAHILSKYLNEKGINSHPAGISFEREDEE
jgi:putative mRNA 3-end processing factor